MLEDVTSLNTGVSNIVQYDNIAIVVLMVVSLLQWGVIIALTRGFLSLKDALANLSQLIAVLNARLHKD